MRDQCLSYQQWNVVPNQLSEHPVSTPSSNMELQLNLQMHVITSKSYSIELRHTYESTKLVNQNNSVTVATLVSLSDVYTRLAWLNLCRTSIGGLRLCIMADQVCYGFLCLKHKIQSQITNPSRPGEKL